MKRIGGQSGNSERSGVFGEAVNVTATGEDDTKPKFASTSQQTSSERREDCMTPKVESE